MRSPFTQRLVTSAKKEYHRHHLNPPLVACLVLFTWLFLKMFFAFHHDARAAASLSFNMWLPPLGISIPWNTKGYDSMKLAKAISCAETSCGKDGTAVHRLNCCGVMRFWIDKDGNRQREPKYYKRYEDSLSEVAAIWDRHYKRFPDLELATRWNGEPEHAQQWLNTVTQVYNSPTL